MKLIEIGILALSAALAGVAFTALARTASPPPTEQQQRDNAQTQEQMAMGDHAVTARQRSYFQSLDRGAKGYLITDDVSADPFLSRNFGKCDGDHDGKLLLQEFLSCTHNNPPSEQR